MKINIKISSKQKNELNKMYSILLKLLKSKLFCQNSLSYQNKKIKKQIFTTLKSPHVNKKAQDQYEYRLTTKIIKLEKNPSVFKLLILLKKLKSNFLSNINLQIQFQPDNGVLNPKVLNPKRYKLKNKFKGPYLKLIRYYRKKCLNSSVGRAKD